MVSHHFALFLQYFDIFLIAKCPRKPTFKQGHESKHCYHFLGRIRNCWRSWKNLEKWLVWERICAEKKKEAQGWRKPPKRLPDHQKPHPDRKRHVKKIATWINPSNPLTVSEMALRLGISRGYVRKILTKILGVYQVKKRKVHDLTEKQKAVRYERGKKFMKKYLTRRKLKLLFTMDEMMIRTSDLRGQSNFYYNGNRVVVPENMRKIPRKN